MAEAETPRPQVGLGVLIVRDGSVLLGKRLGSHMAGYYASPGGHLEAGESFAACARREVAEETGLQVITLRILTIGNYALEGKSYVDIDLLAEVAAGTPQRLEPHKCAGWDWYTLDALPAPICITTHRMIEAYRHGFDLHDPLIIEAVLRDGANMT